MQIVLPAASGQFDTYTLKGDPIGGAPAGATFNRIAYSAAHVVADPHRSGELNQPAALDWPRTIEYRRYLIGQGLGVAEAMDTAQRGMGLSWEIALEFAPMRCSSTPFSAPAAA
jgi:hypothetical protein